MGIIGHNCMTRNNNCLTWPCWPGWGKSKWPGLFSHLFNVVESAIKSQDLMMTIAKKLSRNALALRQLFCEIFLRENSKAACSSYNSWASFLFLCNSQLDMSGFSFRWRNGWNRTFCRFNRRQRSYSAWSISWQQDGSGQDARFPDNLSTTKIVRQLANQSIRFFATSSFTIRDIPTGGGKGDTKQLSVSMEHKDVTHPDQLDGSSTASASATESLMIHCWLTSFIS